MYDNGEPPGQGPRDRRADDARALRTALFAVAFFTGAVLVNGILAILLIALLQTLGLWGVGADQATPVSVEGTDELRSTVSTLVRRRTMLAIES